MELSDRGDLRGEAGAVGGEGEVLLAVFRERHDLRPGQKIRLLPDPAQTHVFDAASGARVT